MSGGADEADDELPHPRAVNAFYGHADAEQMLLGNYRSGRMPHAWLIGGPHGVGKATLAYRLARFVLAHPNPDAPEVQRATSLAVSDENPAARLVAQDAHPDLLALERRLNDKGKLPQDIAVDDIRKLVPFFGSTAGRGGWRIAIVDTLDELNRFGANAILKNLEEPPERALLLLISHTPGRVLPTIRSRCRVIGLRALPANDVARAAAVALQRSPTDPDITTAVAAAEGSVARAIVLVDGPGLVLRGRVNGLLDQLPAPDPALLHQLADSVSGSDPAALAAVADNINVWLTARLATETGAPRRAVRIAQAWESVNRSFREAQAYNLDRKPLLFAVFGLLAEAARG